MRAAATLPLAALLLGLAACAGPRGSQEAAGPAARPATLPGVFGARWAAPDFATRVVDAERAAVLDAAVAAANTLGFAVNRIDGAHGRVAGARRQASAFDGATQDTLEVTVTTIAPGSTRVSVQLRETLESGSADAERGAALVTTSLVRDRARYDSFFVRLAEALDPPASE
jgi:hypothetical protein